MNAKKIYFVLVDDEDFEELNKYDWIPAVNPNGIVYAVRSFRDHGNKKTVLMHREILCITNSKIQVDHIDGDGLNNQRYNLRMASYSQNRMNSKKYAIATSIYKGVRRVRKNWRVQIKLNQQSINIGYFIDEIEAAKAYDKAAMKYFGGFANLNFPDEYNETNKTQEQ